MTSGPSLSCLGQGQFISTANRQKGASYPGLEIIAKLAAVLEVEPAGLLKLPAGAALLARPDTC